MRTGTPTPMKTKAVAPSPLVPAAKPVRNNFFNSLAFMWAVEWLQENSPKNEVTVDEIKAVANCYKEGFPTAFQRRWLFYNGCEAVDVDSRNHAVGNVWRLREEG